MWPFKFKRKRPAFVVGDTIVTTQSEQRHVVIATGRGVYGNLLYAVPEGRDVLKDREVFVQSIGIWDAVVVKEAKESPRG